MGDIEIGKCDYCGKTGEVSRKYYHYDIECDCHSPKHFELRFHCKDCVPIEPYETKVTFLKSRLKPID